MDTRIADKLRKLLTLANDNPSPEESAAAFGAAQRLATKHRIELAEISLTAPEDPMVKESFDLNTGRVPSWKKSLVMGVADASGVFPVQSGSAFVFAGRKGDVQTVIYIFAAVCAEIDSLAARLASGKGRKYANSFRMGCASTIAQRLRASSEETVIKARHDGVSESALVKVEGAQRAAKDWFTSGTDSTLRKQRSTHSAHSGGFAAGCKAGESVNLGGNRAVGRGNLALPS